MRNQNQRCTCLNRSRTNLQGQNSTTPWLKTPFNHLRFLRREGERGKKKKTTFHPRSGCCCCGGDRMCVPSELRLVPRRLCTHTHTHRPNNSRSEAQADAAHPRMAVDHTAAAAPASGHPPCTKKKKTPPPPTVPETRPRRRVAPHVSLPPLHIF